MSLHYIVGLHKREIFTVADNGKGHTEIKVTSGAGIWTWISCLLVDDGVFSVRIANFLHDVHAMPEAVCSNNQCSGSKK